MTRRPNSRIRTKPSRVRQVGARRAGQETTKKVLGLINQGRNKKK